jgi:signal transduction histidine kinase
MRLQNQLINDLLDVSRIITGQLRIERDKTFPSMILESAIDTVEPQASARRVAINLALPPDSVIVWGDPSAATGVHEPAGQRSVLAERQHDRHHDALRW